jgi:REP element-mobilizing transposase RayT
VSADPVPLLIVGTVFVPKRRRKAIFGQTGRQLGAIFHAPARQKECQISGPATEMTAQDWAASEMFIDSYLQPSFRSAIIEGHLMSDHVHICIAIPPKHPVALVIGFLKGKSAIAIARLGLSERGGKNAKKREVVAVARKLARCRSGITSIHSIGTCVSSRSRLTLDSRIEDRKQEYFNTAVVKPQVTSRLPR